MSTSPRTNDQLATKEHEPLASQPGAASEPPERRTVHLEVISGPRAGGPSTTGTRVADRAQCRPARSLPTTRDGWLLLAERTVGNWASTLHGAFLMLAGIAGLIVLIGLVFGFGGVMLGALLALAMWPVLSPNSPRK